MGKYTTLADTLAAAIKMRGRKTAATPKPPVAAPVKKEPLATSAKPPAAPATAPAPAKPNPVTAGKKL
jgi:hypothetical protein